MAAGSHPVSAAIGQYFTRLKEQPGDRDAYKTLERLAVQTGDWGKLAEASEVVGDGIKLPLERLSAYLRAAGLHESKLSDDVSAMRCYAKAVGLVPGDPEAVGGLVRILGKQGQWGTAISTVAAQIAAVSSPKRRAELLVESARLKAEQADDVVGAMADLRRALADDPLLPRFREQSEAILGRKNAWEELAQLWRAFAETSSDPVARSGILLDVAAIFRDKLDNASDAAAALEASAAGQPPGSRALLEAAALYQKAGRWSDVRRLLERERAVTTDRGRLGQILADLGALYEGPLGEPAAAADTWLALNKIAPEDRTVFERASQQLARAGRWEDLASIGARALEREKDPARWRELALSTARLYEERLGVQERATKLYEELTRRDPADVEVIEALTRVYEARGRWAELAATCERAAELLGEVAGRSYLHHAASLFEFRLGAVARAVAIYQRLLTDDPSDEFSASALVRLFRESGDPRPLSEALAALARILADPPARREAVAERAALLAGPLEDPLASVACWRETLLLEPSWPPGLAGLAEALRKSLGVARTAPEGSRQADPDTLEGELIEVLDRELGITADPRRQAALHREVAAIRASRGEAEAARSRYEKARQADPSDLESLEALVSVYRKAGAKREEAGTLRELSRLRRQPRERAEASYALGVLYKSAHEEGTLFKIADESELGVDEPWLPFWKLAAEEDPGHRGALKALVDHAESKSDWEGAVTLLAQMASGVTNPPERAALLTRAGDHLHLRLGDDTQAMAKYAAAVSIAPRHLAAARPLADGLFRSGRWAEVEPLYKRFGADLALESTPKGAAEAFWRHGVTLRELGREEEAIFQWKKAVEADSTFAQALEDLALLLKKRAEWRAAREVYAKLLYLAVSRMDVVRQVAAHRALAVIAEALSEPDEAIERYKKVSQLEAGDVDALTALARLYLEGGRWKEALDVYEQLLPYTGDPLQAAKIYVRRGDILSERLDDPARAVDAYAAALQTGSSVEVRLRLADALARARRWAEAAAERSKLADEEEQAAQKIEHLLVLGKIRRDNLRDDAGAREAYERVLDLDPVERRALVALAALYEKAGAWEPLVRVLRVSAETVPSSRAAALSDLRTRIASILADKIGNVVEAIGELRLALQVFPDHGEALARMAELAPADRAFDREALFAHHRLLARDPLRLESLRTVGELYARNGRGERARLIADLLTLMKSPSKALAFVAEGVRRRLSPLPLHPFAPDDLGTRIPLRGEEGPILEVMRILESAADRLYPANLEEKGASSADRLDAPRVPDADSLASVAHAYSRALGLARITIYRARASTVDVSVEPGRTPALLLGPRLLAEPAHEGAHAVARALWFVTHGLGLMAKLKVEVYERLVLAAIAAFLETRESDALAEKAAAKKDDLTLVRRTLPRRKANELRPLARRAADVLGEDPREAVKSWRTAVEAAADRAALLLTGDLPGAIRRALGGGVPAEIAAREPARVAEILRASPEALELTRFAVSEEFFLMREALGFTGDSRD